ncbi:MAG: diphthine--ammonia ligase [Desulfobacteraceae bacterium]|jgi:uncharacterized protein (TIGR00290 family)
MTQKILLAWSGGKDSALALYEIKKRPDLEIVSLITTITEDYDRVSMHGVRRVLLESQAESLGIPLYKIFISKSSSDEEYGHKMKEMLTRFSSLGVSSVVFGDIFLEDLRKFREKQLSKVGMKGIFPLWKKNTLELAHAFINLGFRAIVTSTDSKVLHRKFVGREIDEKFLAQIPPSVDPCGENGEFHSFVFSGPIFKKRLLFRVGKVVLRENRFYYCDLEPVLAA